MSSGRPSRRSGIAWSCAGSAGGVWRNSGYHSAYRRSVSMSPGTTMLARMPNGPSSAARARTKPSSPDLAAVTAAVFGRPVMADCPPSVMMLPRPRCFMAGTTARAR